MSLDTYALANNRWPLYLLDDNGVPVRGPHRPLNPGDWVCHSNVFGHGLGVVVGKAEQKIAVLWSVEPDTMHVVPPTVKFNPLGYDEDVNIPTPPGWRGAQLASEGPPTDEDDAGMLARAWQALTGKR